MRAISVAKPLRVSAWAKGSAIEDSSSTSSTRGVSSGSLFSCPLRMVLLLELGAKRASDNPPGPRRAISGFPRSLSMSGAAGAPDADTLVLWRTNQGTPEQSDRNARCTLPGDSPGQSVAHQTTKCAEEKCP